MIVSSKQIYLYILTLTHLIATHIVTEVHTRQTPGTLPHLVQTLPVRRPQRALMQNMLGAANEFGLPTERGADYTTVTGQGEYYICTIRMATLSTGKAKP